MEKARERTLAELVALAETKMKQVEAHDGRVRGLLQYALDHNWSAEDLNATLRHMRYLVDPSGEFQHNV